MKQNYQQFAFVLTQYFYHALFLPIYRLCSEYFPRRLDNKTTHVFLKARHKTAHDLYR